jgi:hypothetical protein
MHYNPTVIGHLTITEPFSHRYQGYETASWYTVMDVQPGRYDIVATYSDLLPDLPYYMTVCADAVITDEYFPASFGGMYIGDGPLPKPNLGKPTKAYFQVYGYEAAKDLAGRWHGTVEWLDGYEVVPDPHSKYGTAHVLKKGLAG